jgi:hypothetical protein
MMRDGAIVFCRPLRRLVKAREFAHERFEFCVVRVFLA